MALSGQVGSKSGGDSKFYCVPEGDHMARIAAVIELGKFESKDDDGKESEYHKCLIVFEVLDIEDQDAPTPVIMSQSFGLYFGPTAKLRKLMNDLQKKGEKKYEDGDNINPATLLNRAVWLGVDEKRSKKDNAYGVIASIRKLSPNDNEADWPKLSVKAFSWEDAEDHSNAPPENAWLPDVYDFAGNCFRSVAQTIARSIGRSPRHKPGQHTTVNAGAQRGRQAAPANMAEDAPF